MIRDCDCRLGFRCGEHRQCQDDGRAHDWVESYQSYRLVWYVDDPRGEEITHYECSQCDRVRSEARTFA